MRAKELVQRPDIGMAQLRKGSTMFKTTIVVWLVLLVLAVTVVAFVTRIIEECRLPRDLSIPQKEPTLSHKPVNR
jgi:hypothetical protein